MRFARTNFQSQKYHLHKLPTFHYIANDLFQNLPEICHVTKCKPQSRLKETDSEHLHCLLIAESRKVANDVKMNNSTIRF